jgi:hypothetical protein
MSMLLDSWEASWHAEDLNWILWGRLVSHDILTG